MVTELFLCCGVGARVAVVKWFCVRLVGSTGFVKLVQSLVDGGSERGRERGREGERQEGGRQGGGKE